MSKSLGNSPDPLDLISEYGADGVRIGMLRSSPAGNDLMFDVEHCVWGRNFANKIWNAFRLIKGWEVDENLANPNKIAIDWFKSRFSEGIAEIENNFSQFRISEAMMSTYKLVRDEFCDWYLEMIKPGFEKPIDKGTYLQTIAFFEDILKVLHPFMPFITEELWHDADIFGKRATLDCCIVAKMPGIGQIDTQLLKEIEIVKEVVTGIRNTRQSKSISPKETLDLYVKESSGVRYDKYKNIITVTGNTGNFHFVSDKINDAASFRVSKDEFYIPLAINIDKPAEIERLTKEKEYLHGFLKSVEAKLGNERFMNNAKPGNYRHRTEEKSRHISQIEDN